MKRRRGSRVFVVSHRGRSSAPVASASPSSLEGTFYVATVPGGPPDMALTVTGGVVVSVSAPVIRCLEWFDYAAGPTGSLDGGQNWNGAGLVILPETRLVISEFLDGYAEGAVVAGTLSGGMGWSGNGEVAGLFTRQVASEGFDYSPGVIDGGTMTLGSGWEGPPALYSY